LAVATAVALSAAMVPLRDHVNAATPALVLVVPVVAGVTVGGPRAGLVATATCFLVYDFVFLPPYYTLYVDRADNWVALGVYAVVMALVSRVVSAANLAKTESEQRAAEIRRLFDLSELLVRELPAPQLLDTIVNSVKSGFNLDGVALLLPAAGGRLELAASAGAPLSEADAQRLSASAGPPVHLGPVTAERGNFQAVALVATGQAIGLLAVRGSGGSKAEQELLRAFANHLALALERAGLREEAVRGVVLGNVASVKVGVVPPRNGRHLEGDFTIAAADFEFPPYALGNRLIHHAANGFGGRLSHRAEARGEQRSRSGIGEQQQAIATHPQDRRRILLREQRRLAQFLFGPLAVGDIADHADQNALAVERGALGTDLNRKNAAVLAAVLRLEDNPPLIGALHLASDPSAPIVRAKIENAEAEQLIPAVSVAADGGCVGFQNEPVRGAYEEDDIAAMGRQQLETPVPATSGPRSRVLGASERPNSGARRGGRLWQLESILTRRCLARYAI